jgi:hypothetical protein
MSDLFHPKSGSIRPPTANGQVNGQIVNPPRMNQFGGLDKLKEKYGPHKNDKTIKKPGSK